MIDSNHIFILKPLKSLVFGNLFYFNEVSNENHNTTKNVSVYVQTYNEKIEWLFKLFVCVENERYYNEINNMKK